MSYAIAGEAELARQALEDYIDATAEDRTPGQATYIDLITGLVLVAENRPAEALPHLEKGQPNPYADVGLMLAYEQLGRAREAEMKREALLTRTNFGLYSTALPIAKYKARRR
ncbi:MAG TPA: hypothetical protein VMM35_06545 [Longimicrobiales bacterium]|nr:hypothetical protein [Longimicrobiales bacterium]